MDALTSLRVVLVHDWLTGMRGGEKVLEFLCRRWPQAPLYTLIHKRGSVSCDGDRPIVTCKVAAVERYYRYTLPMMPWAVGWRRRNVIWYLAQPLCRERGQRSGGRVHCAIATPMRYAWHVQDSYFHDRGWGGRRSGCSKIPSLRDCKRRAAAGVTHFIANSQIYASAFATVTIVMPLSFIRRYTDSIASRKFSDYYLILSAFRPYKNSICDALPQTQAKTGVLGSGKTRALRRWQTSTFSSSAGNPMRCCATTCAAARRCSFPARKISASCPSRRRRAARP